MPQIQSSQDWRWQVAELPGLRAVSDPVTWFSAGNFTVNFTIAVDPLAAIMLATVRSVAGSARAVAR